MRTVGCVQQGGCVLLAEGLNQDLDIRHRMSIRDCLDPPTFLIDDVRAGLQEGYSRRNVSLSRDETRPGVTYIGCTMMSLHYFGLWETALWATNVDMSGGNDDLPRVGQLIPLDDSAEQATRTNAWSTRYVQSPGTPPLIASKADDGARKALHCAEKDQNEMPTEPIGNRGPGAGVIEAYLPANMTSARLVRRTPRHAERTPPWACSISSPRPNAPMPEPPPAPPPGCVNASSP